MTVLVAAASRHGATAEIADAIGRTLAQCEVEAVVARAEDVRGVAAHRAVVLGSAVYMGSWLEPARRLVEEHGAELAARPTWLFSSGPVGSPPRPAPDEAVRIDEIAARAGAREHRVFPGRIDRSLLGFAERAVLAAVRAADGDYRDWDEIAAWASGIATALRDEAGTGAR